jgi:hypothetical protein
VSWSGLKTKRVLRLIGGRFKRPRNIGDRDRAARERHRSMAARFRATRVPPDVRRPAPTTRDGSSASVLSSPLRSIDTGPDRATSTTSRARRARRARPPHTGPYGSAVRPAAARRSTVEAIPCPLPADPVDAVTRARSAGDAPRPRADSGPRRSKRSIVNDRRTVDRSHRHRVTTRAAQSGDR